MQLPSGFHQVSRGEQAAILMNVISGASTSPPSRALLSHIWRSATETFCCAAPTDAHRPPELPQPCELYVVALVT